MIAGNVCLDLAARRASSSGSCGEDGDTRFKGKDEPPCFVSSVLASPHTVGRLLADAHAPSDPRFRRY